MRRVEQESPFRAAGFSLTDLLLASALLAVVVAAATRFLGTSFRSANTIGKISDLDMLKYTIRESLSCEQTIGSAIGAVGNCLPSYPVLKRADGSVMLMTYGAWNIRAKCDPVKKNLVIEVIGNSGTDVTTRTWRDLYNGTSDLCRIYFSGYSCPPGQTLKGTAGNFPLCLVSASAGGRYSTRSFQPSVCRSPNPVTGSCSCPSGFSPVQTAHWAYSPGYSFDLVDPSYSGSRYVQPATFYCDALTVPQVPWNNPADPSRSYRAPVGGCGTSDYVCLP